jgi:hypothetical protein
MAAAGMNIFGRDRRRGANASRAARAPCRTT